MIRIKREPRHGRGAFPAHQNRTCTPTITSRPGMELPQAPFWVWQTRGEIEVRPGVKLFAAMNNIFDINDHPIFIGLDSVPCGANAANQNGACGNSMPGREVMVGAQVRF